MGLVTGTSTPCDGRFPQLAHANAIPKAARPANTCFDRVPSRLPGFRGHTPFESRSPKNPHPQKNSFGFFHIIVACFWIVEIVAMSGGHSVNEARRGFAACCRCLK